MPPNLSRLRPLKMKRSPFGIGKLISRFVPDSKLWVMTGTSIVIRVEMLADMMMLRITLHTILTLLLTYEIFAVI